MTFAHQWFLAGLAAALVPLLLHVLASRRVRRIPFSTLYFLRLIHRRRALRIRISRILLLAARVALVLLLTLAFAQPYFVTPALAFLNAGPRVVAILWDNAASMQATDGARTMLAIARERGAELLVALSPRDQLVVVSTSPAPALVHRGPVGDFTAAALPDATAASADRIRALSVLADAVSGHRRSDVVLALFSDFRKAAWPAGSGPEAPAGGLRPPSGARSGAADAATGRATVLLFPVRLESYANWAIGRATVGPPSAAAGETVLVELALAYTTSGPRRPVSVQVKVDGRLLDRKTMASSSEPVRTQLALKGLPEGVHRIEVQLSSGDCLPVDDRRELVVRVLPHRRVLVVNGKKRATPVADEAFFLRKVIGTSAVQRPGFFAREVLVDVARRDLSEREDLESYQLVVLANVAAIPDPLAARLARYVDLGGTLLAFLGDQVEKTSWNRGPMSWTGWSLDRRAEVGGSLRVDEDEFALFPALADESLWRPIAVERHYLMRRARERSARERSARERSERSLPADPALPRGKQAPASGPAAPGLPAPRGARSGLRPRTSRSALTGGWGPPPAGLPVLTGDGSPFLLLAGRGNGLAVFVNASASTESSDLPLHPVFPVLVSEASRLSGVASGRQYEAGERVVLPLASEEARAVLTVQHPDGKITALKPGASGSSLFVAFDSAQRPGIYQFVRRTPQATAVTPFVVVPTPRESDLAPVPAAELVARFGSATASAPGATIVSGPGQVAGILKLRVGAGLTLVDLLLYLVVALVAAELFLVWDLERRIVPAGGGEAAASAPGARAGASGTGQGAPEGGRRPPAGASGPLPERAP
jgi:hypothetical protein